MPETRNNHYVPKWYQEGFLEPGQDTFAYLDLSPTKIKLEDGRVFAHRAQFESTPERCFCSRDLYSTFFGTSVNDEIERRLFGPIDSKGAEAVRAIMGRDAAQWVEHFNTFFTYVDAQKLRTPKGLDWLKAQYPSLDQNELMMEMQGIQTMHCAIWSASVREIVSAEKSDVKFIITDHPVTIYNHALPPEAQLCQDPNEPWIALKASQTIFPLNRDLCLILSNLEYARDPAADPTEKRTFARNFNDTLTRADKFIRERKLTAVEVSRINYILKRRARRYVAAGRAEWLYPEKMVGVLWSELRETLAPPKNSLLDFGGEIFVKYKDGSVRYQDEFGRSEKRWELLDKNVDERDLRPNSACGCGSGKRFDSCCKALPIELRPSWAERGIRERNLFLYRALKRELDLDGGKDWVAIRSELKDEQISRIYSLFAGLWPLETDLLRLLPKPDGAARAVYTGCIHPTLIQEFALGASLYFGEILIDHPFVHAGPLRKEFSPIENPKPYRQEFLKSVIFFLTVMPLVEIGLVNLVPDPCSFDPYLRTQMHRMAQRRVDAGLKLHHDARVKKIMEDDTKRSMLSLPTDALSQMLKKFKPDADDAELQLFLKSIERLRHNDPLATLQDGTFDSGKNGGLINTLKLSPNFEMTMYLAQAVGGTIITDSEHRWNEIQASVRWRPPHPNVTMMQLAQRIDQAEFAFVEEAQNVFELSSRGVCNGYPALMRQAIRYATQVEKTGPKTNFESSIAARFSQVHSKAQASIAKSGVEATRSRITCAFPWGGIQDNSINRLLLMSSSEHHLPSAPMAFFVRAA
jgi:uncharacterized protein YchJ